MEHQAYQIDHGGPSIQPQYGLPASKLEAVRHRCSAFIRRFHVGMPYGVLITIAVVAMGVLSCDPLGVGDGAQLRGTRKAVHVAVLPSFLTGDPVNRYLKIGKVHEREGLARLVAWPHSALRSVTQTKDSSPVVGE
jgi:hypothetical protein